MGFEYAPKFIDENHSVFRCAQFRAAISGRYASAFDKHSGQLLSEIGGTAVELDCVVLFELNIKVFLFDGAGQDGIRRIFPLPRTT